MPLVRISMNPGRSLQTRKAIGEAVHRAMVEAIKVPEKDKFQVVTEEAGLAYDASYLDIQRSDGIVFVQITLNAGRTVEMKKALYARIAERLAEAGVRKEDVLVSLVEVSKENWSFGNGIAQYA